MGRRATRAFQMLALRFPNGGGPTLRQAQPDLRIRGAIWLGSGGRAESLKPPRNRAGGWRPLQRLVRRLNRAWLPLPGTTPERARKRLATRPAILSTSTRYGIRDPRPRGVRRS